MSTEDFSQSSTAPESSVDRARPVIAEQRIRTAAEAAAGNPLSPEAQAAARINKATETINTLKEYRETVAGSGNYTLQGIGDLLAPEKDKAREAVQALLADHEKAGEVLLEQAREASAVPVLEYTDADARVLQAFGALPAEQQAGIRREAIASSDKHSELVRALLAAPAFIGNLDKRTRARLELRFDTSDPAKREAILEKARIHQNSALALNSALAEIDAFD